MQIGAVYPQTELPADPGAVRAYVEAVEGLGYRHILAYDHVVGADPAAYPGWSGPYDIDTTFHEPLVFFGFLAGLSALELVTGVIIAPQRQTTLLAKQAAEVDILTEGRFRLGLGIGWNRVEYEALGQDFATRGQREEEQVALLRAFWTERSVSHQGRFDKVTGAGLAPRPVQRPIPIWLGGQSGPAYRRIGRLADGWFPQVQPGPDLDRARAVIAQAALGAGREPSALGMEGRVGLGPVGADAVVEQVHRWEEVGATHVSVNTMGAGLAGVGGHQKALSVIAEGLGLARGR
jgi:probable F420-dependent oxidoreductase